MNMDGPLKGVREEVPLTHIVRNVTQNIKKKKTISSMSQPNEAEHKLTENTQTRNHILKVFN